MKAHTCAPMHNVAAAPHRALRQISYDLLTDADLDEAPQVLLEHQVDPPIHSHTACPPGRLSVYPPLPRKSSSPTHPPSAPQLPRLLPRSLPPPDAHTRSPTARCTRTHAHTHDAHGSPGSRACSCAQVLFVVGHSEYWSARMYEAVRAFLASGGSVIVLSGNTMCAPCCRACARARAYDCAGARSCGCVRLHACTSAANGATGARIART